MLAERTRAEYSQDTAATQSVLLLEITQGSTSHPVRPVTADRFLIGASAACDLRLGGDSIPPLHSVIVREADDRFRWEKVSGPASLFCNGRLVDSSLLHNGDSVQIGGMEFRVWLKTAVEQTARESTQVETTSHDDSSVEDLSASQLADRLQAEWETVEEYDSRRQLGMESLLAAVSEHVDTANTTGKPSVAELKQKMRQLADQLSLFTQRAATGDDVESTGSIDWQAKAIDAERRLNDLMRECHIEADASRNSRSAA